MSHIKNLFFDELARATQPVVHLVPPRCPSHLRSARLTYEGVSLLCYFEYTPAGEGLREPMSGLKLEPDYPARVTIVNVYVRDVDIMPLLPFETIDKLEHDLLAERGDDL